MSALHIEAIPMINEVKEGLELSLLKTKQSRYTTVDKDRKDELSQKEKRITEILIHIYNTLPACTPAAQE